MFAWAVDAGELMLIEVVDASVKTEWLSLLNKDGVVLEVMLVGSVERVLGSDGLKAVRCCVVDEGDFGFENECDVEEVWL